MVFALEWANVFGVMTVAAIGGCCISVRLVFNCVITRVPGCIRPESNWIYWTQTNKAKWWLVVGWEFCIDFMCSSWKCLCVCVWLWDFVRWNSADFLCITSIILGATSIDWGTVAKTNVREKTSGAREGETEIAACSIVSIDRLSPKRKHVRVCCVQTSPRRAWRMPSKQQFAMLMWWIEFANKLASRR